MNNVAGVKRAQLVQEACRSIKSAPSARIGRLWVCAMLAEHIHASYCCTLELGIRAAIDTVQIGAAEERTWDLRRESVRRTVQRLRNGELERIELRPALVQLAAGELVKREKKLEFFSQLLVPRRNRGAG